MRLFLGLSIPPSIADELAGYVEQVKTKVPSTAWVPRENWHITLLFLGEVAPRTATALQPHFAAVARQTAPFSLRIQDWGAFPNMKRAKLLWAGVEGEQEPLRRLAGSLHEAAAAFIPLEKGKSFVPHITLTRKVPVHNVAGLNDNLPIQTKDWNVHQMHLYVSHLSPGGARYEIWQSYPFGAPQSASPANRGERPHGRKHNRMC